MADISLAPKSSQRSDMEIAVTPRAFAVDGQPEPEAVKKYAGGPIGSRFVRASIPRDLRALGNRSRADAGNGERFLVHAAFLTAKYSPSAISTRRVWFMPVLPECTRKVLSRSGRNLNSLGTLTFALLLHLPDCICQRRYIT